MYQIKPRIGLSIRLPENWLKADMNNDKPLQTAAIFFISNFYLKQGIG